MSAATGRRQKWFWKGCKPNFVCALRRRESFVSAADTRNPFHFRETWSGPLRGSLFGLAPDGVFRASRLTPGAVGSYSTFSPLPRHMRTCAGRFVFCGTIRQDASRHRCPRVSASQSSRLRGIAPYGVRTFLPLQVASEEAILRLSKIGEIITCGAASNKSAE